METFHSKLLGLLVKPRIVTIKMKATKQYFPVVLFIMLHKAVPTFGYVDEIVVCDPSDESYWAVLLYNAIYFVAHDASNWVCGWNPKV